MVEAGLAPGSGQYGEGREGGPYLSREQVHDDWVRKRRHSKGKRAKIDIGSVVLVVNRPWDMVAQRVVVELDVKEACSVNMATRAWDTDVRDRKGVGSSSGSWSTRIVDDVSGTVMSVVIVVWRMSTVDGMDGRMLTVDEPTSTWPVACGFGICSRPERVARQRKLVSGHWSGRVPQLDTACQWISGSLLGCTAACSYHSYAHPLAHRPGIIEFIIDIGKDN